jgi:hypothetical protein
MAQAQYVQKPYKVKAEQYVAGMTPPDATTRAGLCVCIAGPFTDGRPHVHGRSVCYELHPSDWMLEDIWSPHDWSVIPDAEFQDRF